MVGAAAPVHETGTSQLVPIQPAVHVPHVYPLAPIGVQPVALCTQGSGVHAMFVVPLELELELEAPPPVPLELLLAPPAPLELLLAPPVPLELLLDVVVMPPAPLELLELVVPNRPVLPFDEPQPAARTPSATTGNAAERRGDRERMSITLLHKEGSRAAGGRMPAPRASPDEDRRHPGEEEGGPWSSPFRHAGHGRQPPGETELAAHPGQGPCGAPHTLTPVVMSSVHDPPGQSASVEQPPG